MVPLTRTFYVDKGTALPADDQTGSMAAPFSTVQAGVDALAELGEGGGVLLIAPGEYTENVLMPAIEVLFQNASGSTGIGGAVDDVRIDEILAPTSAPILWNVNVGAISCVGSVAMFNCSVDVLQADEVYAWAQNGQSGACLLGEVIVTGPAVLNGMLVDGDLASVELLATDSVFNGGVSVSQFVEANHCIFEGEIEAPTFGRSSFIATDCTINGEIVSGEDITIRGGSMLAGVTSSTLFVAENATIGPLVTAARARIIDCTGTLNIAVAQNLTIANFEAEDPTSGGTIVVGDQARILRSTIPNSLNVTGELIIDRLTLYPMLRAGIAVTNGSRTIVDLLSETVAGVVPAVAADAVGYLDVSMVGTILEGIDVGDPILVNPTADLVAAGPGGGLINARVSALNTVRLAFNGALAGGASNFVFTRP